ncbi:Rpn family recombination-promoting nuclease/putative transposase [Dyadobacter bucti]|uniref:Rpn family recombination-promoting nuclease/putative transposase n=1 Tax=Dyadobacter bucti TaxID=2572203 RepID=UPI003F72FCF5
MEESFYIPLISDYGFKASFGNETDTLFLRTALQALIKSDTKLREVIFDKNAFTALTVDSRSGIFDLSCIDENDNAFIVEMQLGKFPNFVQRMKFYALHKFNTMVEKGRFDYSELPKLYCIAIVNHKIFATTDYHTVSCLRSENGEVIDGQMTFITVELPKFTKQEVDILTDLDKLLFTMNTLHQIKDSTQYPDFWNEEWLKKAIDELDTRKMTPDERASFARITAANAEAVNAEKRRLDERVKEMIINALSRNLEINVIAEIANVAVDFVLNIKKEISKER